MSINFNHQSDKISVLQDITIDAPGALKLPTGLTSQRPLLPLQGHFRFNTNDATFEGYDGTSWKSISDSFSSINVVDSDSGYSWSATGNLSASGSVNEFDLVSGIYIDVDVDTTNGAFRFTHENTTRTDTTSSLNTDYGDSFDVIDSLTTNSTGHVTAINLKTITLPAAGGLSDTLQDISLDNTDAVQYITFVPNTSGAQTGRVDGGLTYNPSSNNLTVSGDVTIGGNLTVNGTTTTVNSTTVTIDDPIFTLGGDTAHSSDDNKDRGIEFRWHNGTSAKTGFFGFDDSTGKFTFIPDATNNNEVFSGTKGTLDANIEFSDILNVPTYDNYVSWSLSDGSTTQTISSGNTVTVTGDSYITTSVSATDTITIAHNNTTRNNTASSVTPGEGNSFEVVDTITTNATGHVTAVNTKTVTLPTDTDTIDSVSSRGNTTTNGIEVGSLKINSSYVLNDRQATISTTSQTAVNLFSTTTYGSAKIIIQATDTVTGERQMSELLVAQNGLTAKATEYGIVYTGISKIATYEVDISAGNVRLLISNASTNTTDYKVMKIINLA